MLSRSLFIAVSTFLFTLGAGSMHAELPRIRALDTSIEDLLASGSAKSATFRTLVDQLEQSDVIVHVEPWPPRRYQRRVGGMLRFVARAGGFRYLRITIDTQLPHATAVALLGHELQHAWEVATDASVVNDVAFETLYRRIGHLCRDATLARSYDTSGARDVERRIGGELRDFSRRVVARR